MGKATGFMTYQRQLPADRQPLHRIDDWQEFHLAAQDKTLQAQGARCMNCGIPYCHMGLMIEGAAAGCPIHNLIPEFNDLIYRGLWQEAFWRLMKTNNFPEFTGRVCPAPCEGSCTVGLNLEPVTIKLNECALADKAWEKGWLKPRPPKKRTGRKAAIVGSGPAGLACADQLNRAGHCVTVYEKEDRIGGLLMYGIPNMKLDKQLVQRRVKLMADEGISFKTSCEIGRDLTLAELKTQYDAVILCGGAEKPRDLPVPGRDLPGIHFAVDFLKANTRFLLDHKMADTKTPYARRLTDQADADMLPDIHASGKDVLVIGGGDTGTDCVGTAIRQGCRSVCQLEIMPKPVDARGPQNPWPQWPKVLKTDYGQEEAAALYGQDPRLYLTTAEKFVADEQGKLAAVETVAINWQKNEQGRLVPVSKPDTRQSRPAQLVLLAMGFLGPDETVLNSLSLERDQRGNIYTAEGSYQTSVPGLFAAGDIRRGQSLVVWAIHEGRQAARACDAYLQGKSLLPE